MAWLYGMSTHIEDSVNVIRHHSELIDLNMGEVVWDIGPELASNLANL